MPVPTRNLWHMSICWNCSTCKTRFSSWLATFQGICQLAIYMWHDFNSKLCR